MKVGGELRDVFWGEVPHYNVTGTIQDVIERHRNTVRLVGGNNVENPSTGCSDTDTGMLLYYAASGACTE